jgi:hypothetical protein
LSFVAQKPFMGDIPSDILSPFCDEGVEESDAPRNREQALVRERGDEKRPKGWKPSTNITTQGLSESANLRQVAQKISEGWRVSNCFL